MVTTWYYSGLHTQLMCGGWSQTVMMSLSSSMGKCTLPQWFKVMLLGNKIECVHACDNYHAVYINFSDGPAMCKWIVTLPLPLILAHILSPLLHRSMVRSASAMYYLETCGSAVVKATCNSLCHRWVSLLYAADPFDLCINYMYRCICYSSILSILV